MNRDAHDGFLANAMPFLLGLTYFAVMAWVFTAATFN